MSWAAAVPPPGLPDSQPVPTTPLTSLPKPLPEEEPGKLWKDNYVLQLVGVRATLTCGPKLPRVSASQAPGPWQTRAFGLNTNTVT